MITINHRTSLTRVLVRERKYALSWKLDLKQARLLERISDYWYASISDLIHRPMIDPIAPDHYMYL